MSDDWTGVKIEMLAKRVAALERKMAPWEAEQEPELDQDVVTLAEHERLERRVGVLEDEANMQLAIVRGYLRNAIAFIPPEVAGDYELWRREAER